MGHVMEVGSWHEASQEKEGRKEGRMVRMAEQTFFNGKPSLDGKPKPKKTSSYYMRVT
jgi:hypothetical protein